MLIAAVVAKFQKSWNFKSIIFFFTSCIRVETWLNTKIEFVYSGMNNILWFSGHFSLSWSCSYYLCDY
jgi:hypothetical protein